MNKKKSQRGMTLAMTLVLLSIITLAAVSAMQNSGIQSKMTANYRHSTEVFNTANNALSRAFNSLNKGETLSHLIAELGSDKPEASLENNDPKNPDISTQLSVVYTGTCKTCMKGYDLNQFEGISMELTANSHALNMASTQYSGVSVVVPSL